MPSSVAIVGSGPAGLYAALAVRKARPETYIDVLERLPTPYGLLRTGVAPDHQDMKRVEKALSRVFSHDEVRFRGHVEIGRHLSLAELRELYDAVILACGAPVDRKLGIEGEDLDRVYGSAEFVGWYNGHPDFAEFNPHLDVSAVAVVGVGNVALDVARVLAKTRPEMATSDIPEHVEAKIERAPLKDIYILGRRGPLEAKFTPAELREMGALERAAAVVDPNQLPPDEAVDALEKTEQTAKRKNLALLRSFVAEPRPDAPLKVHFHFYSSPEAILGDGQVEKIRVARTKVVDGRTRTTGETFELDVGCVFTAIGYGTAPLPGLHDGGASHYDNTDGHIDDHLWVVGWARRGPTGTIGTNRADAREVVERMLPTLGEGKPGPAGLDRLLAERNHRPVTYAEWERIDAAEREAGTEPAPRKKFVRTDELLRVAHRS